MRSLLAGLACLLGGCCCLISLPAVNAGIARELERGLLAMFAEYWALRALVAVQSMGVL